LTGNFQVHRYTRSGAMQTVRRRTTALAKVVVTIGSQKPGKLSTVAVNDPCKKPVDLGGNQRIAAVASKLQPVQRLGTATGRPSGQGASTGRRQKQSRFRAGQLLVTACQFASTHATAFCHDSLTVQLYISFPLLQGVFRHSSHSRVSLLPSDSSVFFPNH